MDEPLTSLRKNENDEMNVSAQLTGSLNGDEPHHAAEVVSAADTPTGNNSDEKGENAVKEAPLLPQSSTNFEASKQRVQERLSAMEPHAIKAVGTAVKGAKFVASGRFLPMCSDKVRNNVKNRLQLISVYVYTAAVVALVIILTLYRKQENPYKMEWAVPPAPTALLGVPMPSFSVQITDSFNRGIPNVEVEVNLTPISDIDLVTTVPDGSPVFGRKVICIQSKFLAGNLHAQVNAPLCVPSLFRGKTISNTTFRTDSFGLAQIVNLTLGLGAAVDYLVVVSARDTTPGAECDAQHTLLVHQFVSFKAAVLSMNAKAIGVEEWYGSMVPFDVQFSATIFSPVRPTLLGAQFMPVQVQPLFGVSRSATIPWPINGTYDKTCLFGNLEFVAATTEFINSTSDPDLWSLNITFKGIQINALNSGYQYFGVFFQGRVLLVTSDSVRYQSQFPQHLALPFVPNATSKKEVGSGRAEVYGIGANYKVIPLDPQTPTIREGQIFLIKFWIYDREGNAMPDKTFILHVEPSSSKSDLITGNRALLSPAFLPKQLINPVGITPNASEIAKGNTAGTHESARFSVDGAAGWYDLSYHCDGVPVTWQNTSKEFFSVYVSSSIEAAVGSLNEAPWAPEYVEVLESWQRLPTLQVGRRDPIDLTVWRGIPGKRMAVVPEDPSKIGLTLQSLPSDDLGNIHTDNAMINWAVEEGNYTFIVYADNVAWYNFTLWVKMPTFTSLRQLTLIDQCTYSEFVNFPSEIVLGTNQVYYVRALQYNGNLAPSTLITVQYVPMAPGGGFFVANMTNSSGIAEFVVNGTLNRFVFIPGIATCPAQFNDNLLGAAGLAVPGRSRVRFVAPLLGVGQELLLPDEIPIYVDADWDYVSPETPLVITTKRAWAPGFIAYHYPLSESDRLVYSTDPITNGSTSYHVLRKRTNIQGYNVLIFEIDGSRFDVTLSVKGKFSVQSTELVRSAFPGNSTAGLTFAQPFTVQPVVQLYSDPFRQVPAVNAVAYPQLGFYDEVIGDWNWFEVLSNASYFQFGFVKNVISNASDVLGYAGFNDLEIVGLDSHHKFKLRYCGCSDALNQSDHTASSRRIISACVEENVTIEWPANQVNVIQVDRSQLIVAPGDIIPDFGIKVNRADGVPIREVYYTVEFALTRLQKAQGAAFTSIYAGFDAFKNYSADGSFIASRLFSSNVITPNGVYEAYVISSGARSSSFFITVSNEVSSIALSGLHPPSLFNGPQNYSLQQVLPIAAKVQTYNGIPVNGRALQIALKVNEDDGNGTKCFETACGTLTSVSTLYAVTDSSGIAVFPIAFQTIDTRDVSFSVTLSPRLSLVALQQTVRKQLRVFTQMFGVPLDVISFYAGAEESCTSESLTFYSILLRINNMSLSELNRGDSVSWNTFLSKNAVSNRIQQFEDQLISSAQKRITQAIDTTESPTVRIYNPVSAIEIVRPVPNVTLLIVEFAVPILNLNTNVNRKKLDNSSNDMPVMRLFDDQNRPVSGATLQITPFPDDGVLTVSYSTLYANASGYVEWNGVEFSASAPGAWDLVISSNGGGMHVFRNVVKSEVYRALTLTDIMYILAAWMVLTHGPMFMSSIPFSKAWLAFFAILQSFISVGSSAVLVWVFSQVVASRLLYMYAVFVLVTAVVSALLEWYTVIVSCFGRRFRRLRFMDDEDRAVKIFQYTQFMTTIRMKRLGPPPQKPEFAPLARFKAALSSLNVSIRRCVLAMNKKMGVELVEVNEIQTKTKKYADKPEFWMPKGVPTATTIPVNFLIVIALTLVVLMMITLLMIYVLDLAKEYGSHFLNYLPNPQQEQQIDQSNKLFVEGMVFTIQELVKVDPQYHYLSAVIGPLQEVDIIQILSKVRYFVHALLERLDICFTIGISIGWIVVLVTILLMLFRIRGMIQECRRGEMPLRGGLFSTEVYIGLHVWHFAITHQLVMWPIVAVSLMMSVTVIRHFLIDKLELLVFASLGSIVLQKFLTTFFVKWFLTDGAFMVTRPELYSLWHFVGVVLSTITGLPKSLSRWGIGLGIFSALFARLDISIYPGPFVWLDAAYIGFCSVVISEARQTNPIFLCAATHLLTESHWRRIADMVDRADETGEDADGANADLEGDAFSYDGALRDRGGEKVQTDQSYIPIDVDTVLDTYPGSKAVVNLSRVIARTFADSRNPLPMWEEPVNNVFNIAHYSFRSRRATLERVRNRWWLFYLLATNPSLIPYRKRNLFEDEEELALRIVAYHDADDLEVGSNRRHRRSTTSRRTVKTAAGEEDGDMAQELLPKSNDGHAQQ